MRYYSLEAVINKIHHKRRPKVLSILNDHEVHETEYEHRIFVCPKCGNLRDAFWAKIVYDDDEVYETEFKCKGCNRIMKPVREPIMLKGKRCPTCGEMGLHVQEDMLWD